jgi:hypothetical protein
VNDWNIWNDWNEFRVGALTRRVLF